MEEKDVLKALKNAFHIAGANEICQSAIHDVLGDRDNDIDWIKSHFSSLIEDVQIKAYDIYLEKEKPAAIIAFNNVLKPLIPDNPTKDDLIKLLTNYFWVFDRFFLGLTQGRRPRAGKAFEYIIKYLFDKLDYPYTTQPIINGQPDFLLPNVDHFNQNPMDCIIFTVKRTLRERWRQITTEGTRGHLFYLATIDENVGEKDLAEMLKNRIYLVVPTKIKKTKYCQYNNVISFEIFFKQHLDPLMERWKSNGII